MSRTTVAVCCVSTPWCEPSSILHLTAQLLIYADSFRSPLPALRIGGGGRFEAGYLLPRWPGRVEGFVLPQRRGTLSTSSPLLLRPLIYPHRLACGGLALGHRSLPPSGHTLSAPARLVMADGFRFISGDGFTQSIEPRRRPRLLQRCFLKGDEEETVTKRVRFSAPVDDQHVQGYLGGSLPSWHTLVGAWDGVVELRWSRSQIHFWG